MSEPTRTSAAQRMKLATALKRNMARRKVASRQSPVTSEERAQAPVAHYLAFDLPAKALAKADGEPHAAKGQRNSLLPLPSGEVGMHLGMTGEGIMPATHSPHPKSHRAIPTSAQGRGKGTATS